MTQSNLSQPTTALQAARQVLAQAGTPLHTQALTQQMLGGGLWVTQGRTPEATVYSALFMDLKQRGEASLFIQTAPSTFGLRPQTAGDQGTAQPVEEDTIPSAELETPQATRTFLDAAEAVLSSLLAGEAMRISDLTETARAEGLLSTQGLTPTATMSAQLSIDIQRRQQQGKPTRFERPQPGFVRLSSGTHATASTPQSVEMPEQPTSLQTQLLTRLRTLPFHQLEQLVGRLLIAMGYVEVKVTPPSNDGGIDLRAEDTTGLVPGHIAVQVKRETANICRPAIQHLRGSLKIYERGLFVTTGNFSAGAREEARRETATPIGLLAGEALAGLLIQHRVGVREVAGVLSLLEDLLADG